LAFCDQIDGKKKNNNKKGGNNISALSARWWAMVFVKRKDFFPHMKQLGEL